MPTEQTNCSESTESSCNSSSSSPSSIVLHPVPQINSKNRLKRCRGEKEEDEDVKYGSSNCKISKNNGGNITHIRSTDVKNNSSSSLSSYVGVRMRAWGKWVSEIREPKKKSRIWLGTFATPEMAARAHDVAAMSIKGTSAILNFPQFAHLLPRPATCSPRDVQSAAVKAAHMAHLNPKNSSSSSLSLVSEPSTAPEETSIMTSSSSSLSLVSGITSSSSSSQNDEESRLLSPEEILPEATGQQEELSEIVELPRLGTSYESVESTQEVLSLFEPDEWWDNYRNCEYFFGEENYISNMEFTGLENVVSTSFESFLWQH